MKTRTFGKTGETVSLLGYGCMRFPTKNGRIDEERTERQVISAIEAGVNYFDTAILYPGSEAVLGRILAKGWRDRVLVADKIPPFRVHARKDLDRHLEGMLERLQTDRIDFLLVHALNDFEGWRRFRACGFDEWLAEVRAAGRVRHIGFSWHGSREDFIRVVDDFDWEFCQIQYNYLDEQFQAGREGMRHAAAKGLGIVVMEPLRGGMLTGRLPAEARDAMEKASIRRTPAAWAFDWLYDQPELQVVLSGMNEETHIEENIRLAAKAEPGMLASADHAVISTVRDALRSRIRVGCTGCGYCMPCPAGVNIPDVFAMYNTAALGQPLQQRIQYTMASSGYAGGKPNHAGLCMQCGKCERHCPQHIEIRKELAQAHRKMYIRALTPAIGALRLYTRLRAGGGNRNGLPTQESRNDR